VDSTGQFLTEHVDWIRRLARRLVGDAELADDLAQDTCLAVLRTDRSVAPRAPRAWLGTILRNTARQAQRGASRRRRRETAAARAETTPPTDEIVERLAIQRRISTAVEALAEPYRTAILLRFVEGLTSEDIAARMQANPSTVRTWIERGLERLRKRLDAQHGDRRAWAGPLLVWIGPAVAAPAPPSLIAGIAGFGVLLMSMKWIAPLAAILALGLAATIWLRDSDPPAVTPPPAQSHVDVVASRTSTAVDADVDRAVERTTVASTPPAAAPHATIDSKVRSVRGEVRSTRGEPVPDVTIDGGGVTAASSGDGSFEITVPMGRVVTLRSASPAWHTELQATIDPQQGAATIHPVIVVAPAHAIAGTVFDAEGRPLAGSRVARILPADLRARVGVRLDLSETRSRETRTDSAGRFEFDRLGAVEGAVLRATADGHVPAEVPLPDGEDREVRLVLGRPDPVAGALLGVVYAFDGSPAAECHVSIGRASTQTDADGHFALQLADAAHATTLRAVKRGTQPAERRFDASELTPDSGGTPFVTLTLGPPPLRIAGTVVDAGGQPLAGVQVWAMDPTPIGRLHGSAAAVEAYLGGGLTMEEMRARFFVDGRPTADLEQVLRDTPTAMWGWTRSGVDGSFTLEGLLDRDYRLAVMDQGSLARAEIGPYRAGSTGIVVKLPDLGIHAVVAGQLVARDGSPIAGARVRAQCDPMRLALETGGATTMHATGLVTVESDAEGRFRLERVGARAVYLRIDGDGLVPLEYGRGIDGGVTGVDGAPADALRIEVVRRLHVRVELIDPAEADAVAFEDTAAVRRPIDLVEGRSRQTTERFGLIEGRTPVLAITDDAIVALLLRGGQVVRRVPIRLVPDQVNELRL
jgi:RNA polymerase sigma-70 factor (ECF subfamily)